jgi:hypothetical protein
VGQDGSFSIGESPDPSHFQSRALFAGLEQSDGAPKLWFAVLAQAFRDYYGDIPSEGPSRYREVQVNYCRRSARAWFLSDDTTMGSFRWIAELFDLDVRLVRKRLFSGPRIEMGSLDEARPHPSAPVRAAIDDVSRATTAPAASANSVPVEVMAAA